MSSSAHKVSVGRWTHKKWFKVYAPPMLKSAYIGEVPADSADKLINRTLEISLFDITRDLSHIPIKLKFQIYRVDGDVAYTIFKMLELTRDYIRSLVRVGTSKITAIHDVVTRDGARLRFTILAVTAYRCNTSHKRAIRAIMREELEKMASSCDFNELVSNAVFGVIAQTIFTRAKSIYPLKKVEVQKIKVLRYPEGVETVKKREAEKAVAK